MIPPRRSPMVTGSAGSLLRASQPDGTTAEGSTPGVVVAICTCRNPAGLRKLLQTIAGMTSQLRPTAVVVVDNDPALEGLAVVKEIAPSFPFPLRAVVEERAGIPFARNRAIREALSSDADYVLMLDDDEYPADGWLDAMVAEAEATGADVVGGPVQPVFTEAPRPPVDISDYRKAGGRMVGNAPLVESSANVLLTRRLLEAHRERWFSEEFAVSGGSDAEFFRRTARSGARHSIARGAVVYEDIPPSRANPGWLVRRAYAHGNVIARIRALTHGRLPGTLLELPNIAALVAIAAAKLVVRPLSARARLEARIRLARAAGKLTALAGRGYGQYTPDRYR